MIKHDSKGVLEAATESRSLRRRDHLLPLMVERQAQGRVADQVRNVLAKHRHAIADVGPSASHHQGVADAKRRSDWNDRNIERIRLTQ